MAESDGSRAVLITGAAGGIGTAATRALVKRGYRVYAGVRGGTVEPARGVEVVAFDVTDPDAVAAAAKHIADREGERGLHAVVNNAGLIVQGPLELLPASELRRQFEVNVYGVANVTRAFLPLLRRGGGRVVNISAPTARIPVPFLGPIGASKAALQSLSDALRGELTRWRIPVVVIEPGACDTPIFAKAAAAAESALGAADPAALALYRTQLEALAKAGARQRLASPDRVGDVIARAVAASRPRRRYVAGTDARVFGLLSHAPAGVRDRVVARVLGLSAA